MQATVDIIIVNWNAGRQLYNCLQSIAGQHYGFILNRIIIVDNGSVDGSLGELATFDLPLTIIQNAANRGFAAASNQGASGGNSDYFLFLNPDTILNGDSIEKPVEFLEDSLNASIGIVGIQLVDDGGVPNRQCCRFPTPRMFLHEMVGLAHLKPGIFQGHTMTEWKHDESRTVDHVLGAFFLMRRRVFEELGGFDERFFVYKEDLDLSLRANQAGWRSHYFAEARAYHKGGGTSEQIKATRLFYSVRSRTQYSYKHFRWLPATGLLFATIVLEPLARVAWALKRGAGMEIIDTLAGTSRLFVWMGLYPFKRGLSWHSDRCSANNEIRR